MVKLKVRVSSIKNNKLEYMRCIDVDVSDEAYKFLAPNPEGLCIADAYEAAWQDLGQLVREQLTEKELSEDWIVTGLDKISTTTTVVCKKLKEIVLKCDKQTMLELNECIKLLETGGKY